MGAFIFAGGDPSKVDVSGYSKGDVLAADTTGTLQPVTVGPDGEVLTADSAATEGVDWQPGGGGGGGVTSVFGRVGNVVAANGDYTKSQVGLGNVDNTSDANKPVSTAQATAIALKLSIANNLSDLNNAATARTNLGLGTAATQNTGAFDPAGAAAAAQAASQPLDSDLTTIAGLTPTATNVIQSVAGSWASRTPAQLKATLALAVADVSGAAPTASPTFTGTVTYTKSVSTPVTLTDAATVAVDASLGNAFRLTLTASGHTLGAPSNPTDGQMILFEVNSGAGSNTLALASGAGGYAFGSTIASFTMSTGAGKTDLIGCRYNASANRWWVIALVQGY